MFAMFLSLAVPIMVHSQPPAPDSDDIDTPIDGGVSLVIAAGGLIAAKRLRKK